MLIRNQFIQKNAEIEFFDRKKCQHEVTAG